MTGPVQDQQPAQTPARSGTAARVDRREEVLELIDSDQFIAHMAQLNLGDAADALLPLIARFEREAAAKALREMADAVRSTEILFRREDGSGVTYGDLLRERRAPRPRRELPAQLGSRDQSRAG